MKINLDRVGSFRLYGFGVGFYLMMLFICFAIVIWEMPVSWFASTLNTQTSCRLMLHQPAGTLWKGSAAMGFSELDPSTNRCRTPSVISERFQWNAVCHPLQGKCKGHIHFSALVNPLGFHLGFSGLRLDAGEILLPANILEILGSPWTTLRPRGEVQAHWSELDLGGFTNHDSKGHIRILVRNLSSPISPVKPLGTYDVGVNLLGDGGSWDVSAVNGPLLFRGAGVFGKQGLHFSGELFATPESQESLIGLLSMVGKKSGDTYRIQF
jgi:general secretion pathway protein N